MEPKEKSGAGGKRYRTYDAYLKETFGRKCVKVGLDGGFSCPNRDGRKGTGGCAFCAHGGAESMAGRFLPLREQYERGRARLTRKWGEDAPAIAYFQAYTSTYGPVERLRALYGEALSFEGVVGLTVATRADALPPEVIALLAELNGKTVLTVELGLQTANDETAAKMNRGHTYAEVLAGYAALKGEGIRVCVHLIDGLPGEDREEMLRTAREVAALRPDAVKIHELYVRRGSALADEYERSPFPLLGEEEYVEILADQIELLPPETVIERVTGDPERGTLLAPLWAANKKRILADLDKTLRRRGSVQGVRYSCTKNENPFCLN